MAISLARVSGALALFQRRQGARRDLSGRYQSEHRVSSVIHHAGFIKASRGEPLLHGTGILAVLRAAFVLSASSPGGMKLASAELGSRLVSEAAHMALPLQRLVQADNDTS